MKYHRANHSAVRRATESVYSLEKARAAMLAAPVGEQTTALAGVELQALEADSTANGWRVVSRRVLHAAAQAARQTAEWQETNLATAEA